MYEQLAILTLFIFAYSAVAGGIERTWISGPILYTGFGLLLGPYGLNVFSFEAEPELISSLAELTLALVLFHDAAGANLAVLKRASRLPVRLLLVGLPLTILLGYVVGTWLPLGLGALELALLATMLAPTDAALGTAVVTNEIVPADIREGLNVESGLNDGICVPILFIFLALVTGAEGADEPWHLALSLVAREIGIGLIVGLALSGFGFWILRTVHRKGWVTKSWATLTIASLAVCCFAVGQWLGGSGFIASFSGGLLFGGLLREHKEQLLAQAEGIGDTLALITWVMFGSAVVGQAVGPFSWPVSLYAALSLIGLSAILTQYQWLTWFVRILGGAYLVFLGLRLIIKRPDPVEIAGEGPRERSALLFGFVVTLTNPKAIVLFASVFATAASGAMPLWVTVLMIGLVVASSLAWYSAVSLFMASPPIMARFRDARHRIERLAGACFVAIGLKIMSDARSPVAT